MIHTETVVLTITYDDQPDRLPPREWDWVALLDLGPNESVEVGDARTHT